MRGGVGISLTDEILKGIGCWSANQCLALLVRQLDMSDHCIWGVGWDATNPYFKICMPRLKHIEWDALNEHIEKVLVLLT